MRDCVRYDEPFAWWGPVWSPPAPRTILDLIGDGVVDVATAGLLWALLARRASIAVVAGPRGAGKTTLLTALLDFLPPGTRRLYLRGCYEPFGFLDDPAVVPERSALLVNEISAHLPAYLWGPAVRRALRATRRGFCLAATAHAASTEEFVAMLAGYPLRVPLAEIAAIDVVVVLRVSDGPDGIRRSVAGVWALVSRPAGGLALTPLAAASHAPGDPNDPSPEHIFSFQGEAIERGRTLHRLSHQGPLEPAAVRSALAQAATRWPSAWT